MKKTILAVVCLMALITAKAVDINGMLVTSSSAQTQILLTDIAEVTFTDTELSLQLADNSKLSFPNSDGWLISFNADGAGTSVTLATDKSPVSVYNTNGISVANYAALSELNMQDLPAGVYIIVCNGKTFKLIK